MLHRLALTSLLSAALVAPALGDTVIVDENFDSYADDTAFQAAWVPTVGNGSAAAPATDLFAGIITSDTSLFPGLQGKGVDHIGASASTPGMVNQWGGIINQANGQNPVFNIAPSATQSVFLSYDIYDGGSGNERMTVGLRHINVVGATVATTNILEMGFYNSNSADPTNPGDWSAAPVNNAAGNATTDTPGFYNGRGYGARVTIFGPFSEPLHHHPDWQYFRTTGETWGGQALGDIGFTTEIERTTDTDDYVTIGDIGPGWHQYTATITPDTVTITIDLFRDGLRNTSRTPDENGDRPGEPGIDAKMVFPIAANPLGFNSLRIGGPSGLSSAGPGDQAFDNIILKLIDAVTPTDNPDFNDDTFVDGADLLIWQNGYGVDASGDADGDGDTDGRDFLAWQRGFNPPPAALAATVAAVPEPSTGLIVLALSTLLAIRRK